MNRSYLIKGAGLIVIVVGLCAVYLIAHHLYSSPFQFPTQGLAAQKGDASVVSLQEIGRYALGREYFQGVGYRTTAFFAYTVFLPVLIFACAALRRLFSKRLNQIIFSLLCGFMICGGIYFLKKVIDGLTGLEWGSDPNVYAVWILLWMNCWAIVSIIMLMPLHKRLPSG
jgi:hypothetical protein